MKRTDIADLGLRKCNALGQEAPDIWSAGVFPLTDFIHTLTDTFDTQILHTPFKEGMDNYCYLRAKNFSDCSKRQRLVCIIQRRS